MSSGKQTSFESGEVSPSLNFRSEAISYATGLAKLKNMFVRRAGGVSNRAGFKYISSAISQLGIPDEGALQNIKAFTFYDNGVWKLLEYYQKGADPNYEFSINGSPIAQTFGTKIWGPSPSRMQFTNLKDRIFLCPPLSTNDGNTLNASIGYTGVLNQHIGGDTFSATIAPVGLPVVTFGVQETGTAIHLDVSYLVTAIMKDGQELLVTVKTTADGTIYYPHSELQAFIQLVFTAPIPKVKNFNIYRASGRLGLTSSFFKLAGRAFYDGVQTTVKFTDFGADDGTLTPPLDSTLLGANGVYLSGAQNACYYQQRLVMGMEPGFFGFSDINIKAGDMIVSKLGATEQIKAPVIYSDTGSFQFSVPVTDGTPVIASLAMQGLIAFTERATYYIRGGESVGQGVVTPTSVNPLLVSEEGCSKIVIPKMSGSRGYFINSSHTKLMTVIFGADGAVQVLEASIFSDHTLLADIVELEVLGNGENTVMLLRRDGKLVQVTSTDQGSFGFSVLETNGYVESIFRGKAKRLYAPNTTDLSNSEKYYDVLMAYVIRNGIRTLEQIVFRDDIHKEGEFFADCFSIFGQRLSVNGNSGYSSAQINVAPTPAAYSPYPSSGRINIEAADFSAGQPITLRCENPITDDLFVLHFFYKDIEGKEQSIRFTSDGNAGTVISDSFFTRTYVGSFSYDVPSSLQNVRAQALTTVQRNKLYTRWLPAFNRLEGDDALLGPWIAASSDPNVDGSAPVSVSADGVVVSSPLNPNAPTLSIIRSAGLLSLDLPDYYCFGYVGAPYTAEFETLDIETSDSRTLTNAKKLINAVGLGVVNSRGGFFGLPDKALSDMEELVLRDDQDLSQVQVNLQGYLEVNFPTEYNRAGRVNIKQVDPAPISILSVYPKGISGD